ncbi:hypothetical protein L6164_007851 [Bauhinia variegata]|uniref:Uncharacterized protein n=1 Tax=Bauhinia variegata TaxID=167791 RepID=A0ACB9PG21_BAUVA|nr:hypothetical protein L6164_007851 [Bauhinia variegata]
MMNKRILGFATQVAIMAIVGSVILLFVGIGFMVLLHVCIIGGGSRRRGAGGGRSTEDRGENGSTGMSKVEIEKLPCYDYKGEDSSSGPEDCAVCLENLATGDECRLLPICKHSFHAQCVDTWLLKTPFCPICRTRVGSIRDENDHETTTDEIRVQLEQRPDSDMSRDFSLAPLS